MNYSKFTSSLHASFLHHCLLVFPTDTSGDPSFTFFFNVTIFCLYCCLKSSAKEPRQKETYGGDEFTSDKDAHHD